MRNTEPWRLVVEEAKAHPGLYRQVDGRKEWTPGLQRRPKPFDWQLNFLMEFGVFVPSTGHNVETDNTHQPSSQFENFVWMLHFQGNIKLCVYSCRTSEFMLRVCYLTIFSISSLCLASGVRMTDEW
jgi:hypothetical protein